LEYSLSVNQILADAIPRGRLCNTTAKTFSFLLQVNRYMDLRADSISNFAAESTKIRTFIGWD